VVFLTRVATSYTAILRYRLGAQTQTVAEAIARQECRLTRDSWCEELLKASGFVEHPFADRSTAKVRPTALVAADLCGGGVEQSRHFLRAHGSSPAMLSQSRFPRCLPAIPERLWQGLVSVLSAAA